MNEVLITELMGKKIPVYKECPRCDGKGTTSDFGDYGLSYSPVERIVLCERCAGQGAVETGDFVYI